jgi:hypothetical protein
MNMDIKTAQQTATSSLWIGAATVIGIAGHAAAIVLLGLAAVSSTLEYQLGLLAVALGIAAALNFAGVRCMTRAEQVLD